MITSVSPFRPARKPRRGTAARVVVGLSRSPRVDDGWGQLLHRSRCQEYLSATLLPPPLSLQTSLSSLRFVPRTLPSFPLRLFSSFNPPRSGDFSYRSVYPLVADFVSLSPSSVCARARNYATVCVPCTRDAMTCERLLVVLGLRTFPRRVELKAF